MLTKIIEQSKLKIMQILSKLFTELGISANLATYISFSVHPFRYNKELVPKDMELELENEFQQLMKNFKTIEELHQKIVLK